VDACPAQAGQGKALPRLREKSGTATANCNSSDFSLSLISGERPAVTAQAVSWQ